MASASRRFLLLVALVFAAGVPAWSQQARTKGALKLGSSFVCPSSFAAANPDLDRPTHCTAVERISYRGRSGTLVAIDWGAYTSGDTGMYKGTAFALATLDDRFERIDDSVMAIALWPNPESPSRYSYFLKTVGAERFWRNNLDSDRVFVTELKRDERGRLCMESRLKPPFVGAIRHCVGSATQGTVEQVGIIPLSDAVQRAAVELGKQSDRGGGGRFPEPNSSYLTLQERAGEPYWTMTHRAPGSTDRAAYWIRVFSDGTAEIEQHPGTNWVIDTIR